MKIRIGKVEYPAFQTMGAMLAFKRERGKEVTEVNTSDLSELVVYLYCVVRSACKREGVEFPFTELEEFADGVSLEDFQAWSEGLNAKATDEPKAAAPKTEGKAGEK